MDSIPDVDVDSLLQSLAKHQQITAKTVEECLQSCKTQKGLCEAINLLDSRVQEKTTVLKELAKSKLSKHNILINTIKANNEILEQKENDLRQLKNILEKKQQKVANLETKQVSLEAKLRDLQDGENLREMRDKILAYKVLTGVEFYHSTKNVIGTVAKEGQAPKAFSFHSSVPDKEISKELWKLILED